MPGYHRRRQQNGLDAWPGYVDALSTLLMVTIFVLLVFVLAQGLLSVSLNGKDRALERLHQQIAQLTDMLSLEKGRTADLQNNIASLAHDLGEATATRDSLARQLASAQAEIARDASTVASLSSERDQLTAQLADAKLQAQSATARLNDMQGQLGQQTTVATSAQSQLDSLQSALTTAQQKLAADTAQLAQATTATATASAAAKTAQAQVANLETQLTAMEARAKTAESKLTSLQGDLAKQTQAASDAQSALGQQTQKTDAAEAQIVLLNQQMAQLRAQLQALAQALDLQQQQGRDKDAQIADLGRKLNLALAAKVQQLQRYRSDFFGQLREILKDQPNIKIVGDRFVFQSDVLFASGSADLTPAGQTQINDISVAIKKIMKEIPPDLSWMLRVDGHADSQPITGGPFQSNWQLSAARAIAVVQLLILDGVPANHLAATAFGDTQPIDPADTQDAYAKNRRIEFRLTDR
ncbi:peptidoglycan -binding protein [Acidisoma sp. 7E03]